MKSIIQFLKKRKYLILVSLIAFVCINLFYFEYKCSCENFDGGLIKPDVLVEKLTNKIQEYEGVLEKMDKLKTDLTNL